MFFPDRLPLRYVVPAAIILCGIQQLQGTDVLFTLYFFLFVVVAAVTFNSAGGFTRTTGGYVFFYSFGLIVGVAGKAYLGEAADTNLHMPRLTMLVFLGGISSMLAAVFLTKQLASRQPLLQKLVKEKDMQNATIGCILTGFFIHFIVSISQNRPGSFLSALNQVNLFLPMAIILGTVHEIKKSNGTRSINLFTASAAAVMFFFDGLFTYSKQGMFLPILCWFVAASSLRYRLKSFQIGIAFLVGFVLVHYLVPYAQVGRDVTIEGDGSNFTARLDTSFSMLTHLGDVRKEYDADQQANHEAGSNAYYNTPQGLLDRLEIISPDDALINATENNGAFGLSPVPLLFLNLIPHVFYPSKPTLAYGNLYAHEIGDVISEDDYTTGISFSPSGDGYHMAKWVGVLLVAPVLWTMLFALFESLCGDVRQAPWGLLMIAVYSHSAPEGMLGSVIYMMGYTAFGLIFSAYTAAHVMPLIGTLVFGPEKNRHPLTRPSRVH